MNIHTEAAVHAAQEASEADKEEACMYLENCRSQGGRRRWNKWMRVAMLFALKETKQLWNNEANGMRSEAEERRRAAVCSKVCLTPAAVTSATIPKWARSILNRKYTCVRSRALALTLADSQIPADEQHLHLNHTHTQARASVHIHKLHRTDIVRSIGGLRHWWRKWLP